MMMDWLDKIAPEPVGLEAIRDADPEKGKILEDHGGLKRRPADKTAELAYLARRCEEADEPPIDRLAKVDLPEDLRLPKLRRGENRRISSKGGLPWERKAKGEDAYFEAERAAAGRDAKPKRSALTHQTREEAAAEVRTLKGEEEPEPVAQGAELEAERDMMAGLEVREQQLHEAFEFAQRQGGGIAEYAAAELPRHVAQQELMKYAESAVREAAPKLPGYADAIRHWNRHIEQRARAAGVTDPKAIAEQQGQVATTIFLTAINNRVNPALMAYEAAKAVGFRAPASLESISKASDDDLKEELKNFEVQLAGLQGQMKERQRGRGRAA